MAGYIGNKSQTLVDGYTKAAADDEFVNDPNSVIAVSGSNVGIGTSSPSEITGTGLSQLVVGNNAGNNGVIVNCSSSGDSAYSFAVNNAKIGRIGYDYLNNMTFQTNNAERMRIDSNGILKFNSGYGSVANAYGCRAWVNFNGSGTVAIRGSGNVSSITDHAVGKYSVNFSTAMPDTNYSVSGSMVGTDDRSSSWANTFTNGPTGENTYSTSAVRFAIVNNADTALRDCDHLSVQIFR